MTRELAPRLAAVYVPSEATARRARIGACAGVVLSLAGCPNPWGCALARERRKEARSLAPCPVFSWAAASASSPWTQRLCDPKTSFEPVERAKLRASAVCECLEQQAAAKHEARPELEGPHFRGK